MYSLDWSWGWWNRFYSIGGFECIACCGGEEEEKEEEEKGGGGEFTFTWCTHTRTHARTNTFGVV